MDKAAEQSAPIKIAEAVAGSSTKGFAKSPISQNIPSSNQAAEVTNVIENLGGAPIPNTTDVAGATNTTKNLEAVPKSSIGKVTKKTSLKKSTAIDVSIKRTRDAKSNIRNKKPKTANAGTTKINLVSAPESKNLKRKASHPKTSEIVTDAIKSLKKRKGATFEDISKHMDENQQVNMKVFKPYVKKFLMKSVENGSLEKLSGADAVERYKIKKPEKVGEKKSLKKSTAINVSIKRTRDAKSNVRNKKPKIVNAGATKVNLVSAPESKNLKRKASHPKTSEMVMDAIKSLKKRKGATFEDISKHMDENQQVNMKVFKLHAKKFLMKSVENGGLEKLSGADAVERYKIKKPEKVGEKKSPN